MKLSALDIRKQEFAKVFRGYDPEEVDAFRHMLSQQWHLLTEDVRRLEQRIQDQTEKLEHYRKVEEALEEALQSARDAARERLEQAERKAESAIQGAEAKAAAALQRAEQRTQRMVAEGEEFRRQARRTYAEATLRRNEIVQRLRALLAAQMEHLDGFESTEDQRARMDEADVEGDFALPDFDTAAGLTVEPSPFEDDEPEMTDFVAADEEESFDLRDMADLEAEPVKGRTDDEAEEEELPEDGRTTEDDAAEPSGADEEIRKIRRILEDLDG